MPKPAQLLLQHQRLADRERVLRESIERIESVLASDPEVVQLEEKVEAARDTQTAVAARLHESDRAREDHRSRLRSREKELMSGRIRNPTELMQMSEEVKHMKARYVEIADDTMSAATAELEAARARAAAEAPGLRGELEAFGSELEEVESAKEQIWDEVPAAARTAYTRQRVQPAVAVVLNNQCTACRVTVTSRGMQMLRQGDEIVHCENCGRILVLA